MFNISSNRKGKDFTIKTAASCCTLLIGTSFGIWDLGLLPTDHLGGKRRTIM